MDVTAKGACYFCWRAAKCDIKNTFLGLGRFEFDERIVLLDQRKTIQASHKTRRVVALDGMSRPLRLATDVLA